MTGLQRWRTFARGLIVVSFTWDVIGAAVGVVTLALVASRDGWAPLAGPIVKLVGALGLAGFLLWAIRDAQRRGRRRTTGISATADGEAR